MTKDKRDRLFRKSRPHFRTLHIYDGDKYHKDIGILWAAYQDGCFHELPRDLEQSEFAQEVEKLTQTHELWMAEDENNSYQSGKGPVALVSIISDGWKIEPHTESFPWASKRNILRYFVAFFHMIRYKKIGVCVVKSLKSSTNLFNKCKEYGVLFYVGEIINGNQNGDEYIYSVRGKLRCRDN